MRRIDDEVGLAALAAVQDAVLDATLDAGRAAGGGSTAGRPGAPDVPRELLATAVRYTLQRLAEQAPGHALEVRVPPYGAVQAVEGPRHTRGTPPNVVETDAVTWLALATGRIAFSDAIETGRVQASGARADLAPVLPVV